MLLAEAAEFAAAESEGVASDAVPVGADAAADVLAAPVLGPDEGHGGRVACVLRVVEVVGAGSGDKVVVCVGALATLNGLYGWRSLGWVVGKRVAVCLVDRRE